MAPDPAETTPPAELILGGPQWQPEHHLEIRFAEPMVADEVIGTVAETSPVVVKPVWQGDSVAVERAWRGHFEWRSSRSGIWVPGELPAAGADYHFHLAEGLRTLAGEPLPTLDLGAVTGEGLLVADRWPRWINVHHAHREPEFFIQFNHEVDPDSIARHIAFISADRQLVPARVSHASGDHWPDYAEPQATVAERFAGTGSDIDRPAADEVRLNAVVITVDEPLPVGADWRLQLSERMVAAVGGPRLAERVEVALGSITHLEVAQTHASNPFDLQPRVRLLMSKDLAPEIGDDEVAAAVSVEPAPANLKVEREGRWLLARGDFEYGRDYQVRVEPGLVGRDGLGMVEAFEEQVVFEPNPGYLALPAFATGQQSRGQREFRAVMANVEGVRLRVKAVPFDQVPQALMAYSGYGPSGWGQNRTFRVADFDQLPGRVVADWQIDNEEPRPDRSHVHVFSWDDLPGGGVDEAGALFVHAEAVTRAGIDPEKPVLVAQSLVQLSDLGLNVKAGRQGTGLVQAFSITDGRPLEGVQIELREVNGQTVAEGVTGVSGAVALPVQDGRWVLARHGGDSFVFDRDDRTYEIQRWRLGVPVSWGGESETSIHLFTERPLYRPGETAFVKGIVRLMDDQERWQLPAAGQQLRLTLNDPRGREVHRSDHELGAFGTFDTEVELPTGNLGSYHLAAVLTGVNGDDDASSGRSWAQLQIEEFRPNTFEVKFAPGEVIEDGSRARFDFDGRYFMGRPLSKARVAWTASIDTTRVYSDDYPNHAFGDFGEDEWHGWQRWRSWDQDGYDPGGEVVGWGETELEVDGSGSVTVQVPAVEAVLAPRKLLLEASVTDINQQTITARQQVQVDSSAFYLGVERPAWLTRVGERVELQTVALGGDTEAWPHDVEARVEVHRRVWNPVREVTAGGGTRLRHQMARLPVLDQPVSLVAADGAPATGTIGLEFPEGGSYEILVTASDPGGRPVSTRFSCFVYGGSGFGWQVNDGWFIDLEPEQRRYQPGETARVMVKTPLTGPALVTVERAGVRRHFTTELSPEHSMIEVPLEEGDAPNVFISVTQTRIPGAAAAADADAAAAPQPDADGAEVAMPDAPADPTFRVGACEIEVVSDRHLLQVETGIGRDEMLPGQEATAFAEVRGIDGQPVAGAEVTLFAVDEGILSLMPRGLPDPNDVFHDRRLLGVASMINLPGFLGEDPEALRLVNKGEVIGGGGMEDLALDPSRLREDFRACALWVGSAVTDADGRAVATFTVPDSLTRYQIVAVALEGADRFGLGSDHFRVRKPLMVEPVVPRFANLEDQLRLRAVVHNDTGAERQLRVTLATDHRVESLRREVDGEAGSTLERIVTVADGSSGTVEYDVRFVGLGDARWTWSVQIDPEAVGADEAAPAPANEGDDAVLRFVDNVVSTIPVRSPVPRLRDRHLGPVAAGDDLRQALLKLDPVLLEGDGVVRVSLSTSRAFEASEGMEYLLGYPYGCLEQTTSSLLPWLAIDDLGPVFPTLAARSAEAPKVIQTGVDRLLGMQAWNGGFGYWSANDGADLWGSAYAGLALLLAREQGANVPDDAVQQLMNFLSDQLRQLDEAGPGLLQADKVMALHTLALGGRAEVGYHNVLLDKIDQVPPVTRLWLGLAMLEAGQEAADVRTMLASAVDAQAAEFRYWIPNVEQALAAMLWLRLDADSEQATAALDGLLQRRGARGWGSTYANGWTLLAMRDLVRHEDLPAEPLTVIARHDGDPVATELTLAAGLSSAAAEWSLEGGLPEFDLPAGQRLFAKVEVEASPVVHDLAEQRNGFHLQRSYQLLQPDGVTVPIDDDTVLTVGDLVVVTLQFESDRLERFVALDDALPAIFEAVNPNFDTAGPAGAPGRVPAWTTNHRELRTDRALFFQNQWRQGRYSLTYSARVIAEGDVIAPPAKIEAMYAPEVNGLSASQRLRARMPGQEQPLVLAKPSADGPEQ